jgi:hypothetical protein
MQLLYRENSKKSFDPGGTGFITMNLDISKILTEMCFFGNLDMKLLKL